MAGEAVCPVPGDDASIATRVRRRPHHSRPAQMRCEMSILPLTNEQNYQATTAPLFSHTPIHVLPSLTTRPPTMQARGSVTVGGLSAWAGRNLKPNRAAADAQDRLENLIQRRGPHMASAAWVPRGSIFFRLCCLLNLSEHAGSVRFRKNQAQTGRPRRPAEGAVGTTGSQNYGQSVASDGSTPAAGGGGGTNRRIGGG
jgi:hypothetical protein